MTRMTSFIDIQRRFHDLTEKELEDTELLLSWSEYEIGSSVGWSDLLDDDRVVLLAEAGGPARPWRWSSGRIALSGKAGRTGIGRDLAQPSALHTGDWALPTNGNT